MAKEIGGMPIIFGHPQQPKALPLSHPKARWGGFKTETTILSKGSVKRRGCLPLPCDILFERDQPVKLRDGTTIYTDIYRPVEGTNCPALMAWSPYGKEGGKGNQVLDDFPFRMGVPLRELSELQKWEGPDPAYWVQYGYAIVNPDPRGVGKSEGDIYHFGTQEGRDGADVVDWIGSQPWCNGKVATSGNSYLSISSWFIAAEQPQHLAAIAPWEGLSDLFGEGTTAGGVLTKPALDFNLKILQVNAGENSWENAISMALNYKVYGAYHKDKAAKIENINVPAYVAASWSNPIHTFGTFRAYCRLTGEKWLRVHDSWEWPDYYDYANREDLHRFFDYYLKGIENDWTTTPRVRAKILDTASPYPKTGSQVTFDAFPPKRLTTQKLFLNENFTLAPVFPPPSTSKYVASSRCIEFDYTFQQDAICCGMIKLCFAISVTNGKDSDIFINFEKILKNGKVGSQLKIPYEKSLQTFFIRTVNSIGIAPETNFLFYKGPRGQLRLSRRLEDKEHAVEGLPIAKMDEICEVEEGKVMLIEPAVTPIGMSFKAGEKLRMRIGGKNEAVFPPIDQSTLEVDELEDINKSAVVLLHYGLEDQNFVSYIVLPFIEV